MHSERFRVISIKLTRSEPASCSMSPIYVRPGNAFEIQSGSALRLEEGDRDMSKGNMVEETSMSPISGTGRQAHLVLRVDGRLE